MQDSLTLVSLLLCLGQVSMALSEGHDVPPVKNVCVGVNYKKHLSFRLLKSRYENCTHVIGNLELHHIDGKSEPEYKDLSFLENIEEVTGHIVLNQIHVPLVHFKRLRVIRGEHLFRLNPNDTGYALLVAQSYIENLEFPELKEISAGNAGVFHETKLCSVERLNWTDILSGGNALFHYYPAYDNTTKLYKLPSKDDNVTCSGCHVSCQGGCYGHGPDKCRNLTKLICNAKCNGGRCFGDGSDECCHNSCVGGCSGPKRSDCTSCKNVFYNGNCADKCPTKMYSLGDTCVDKCPHESVTDEEVKSCLAQCPHNKYERNRKCWLVYPPAKKCEGHSDMWPIIHSGNINYFKGCTILEQDIYLDARSFSGKYTLPWNFTYANAPGAMGANKLEVFSSLRETTGSITINFEKFLCMLKNVTGFRNVESIGYPNKVANDNSTALEIKTTPLAIFNLKSLREIHGNVQIDGNWNLCYVNFVNWLNITGGQWTIPTMRNGYFLCEQQGLKCSDKCSNDGCWGPDEGECACLDYTQEGKCIKSCNEKKGYVMDGNQCVKGCPRGKSNLGGECLECIENCIHRKDKRFCCPTKLKLKQILTISMTAVFSGLCLAVMCVYVRKKKL